MGGHHFITNLKTWGEEQENLPKLVRKELCRRNADQLQQQRLANRETSVTVQFCFISRVFEQPLDVCKSQKLH